PIVHDTFDLSVEMEAQRRGVDAAAVVEEWIGRYTADLRRLGTVHDWSGALRTHDPGYYRWTQWIFLRLLAAGLAYRADASVVWCPAECLALSYCEVVVGRCSRCDNAVVIQFRPFWWLRIIRYSVMPAV